jgi:uncharacterized protein DUF6252
MRRTLQTLLVAAVVGLAACGSSDSTGPGPDNGSMSAKIDGANWTSSLTALVQRSGNIVSVAGSNGAGKTIIAFAWVDAGVGVYPISNVSPTNASLTDNAKSWTASVVGGSGNVTVTAIDATHVAGTFAFTLVAGGNGASGTRDVTNGQFDIQF